MPLKNASVKMVFTSLKVPVEPVNQTMDTSTMPPSKDVSGCAAKTKSSSTDNVFVKKVTTEWTESADPALLANISTLSPKPARMPSSAVITKSSKTVSAFANPATTKSTTFASSAEPILTTIHTLKNADAILDLTWSTEFAQFAPTTCSSATHQTDANAPLVTTLSTVLVVNARRDGSITLKPNAATISSHAVSAKLWSMENANASQAGPEMSTDSVNVTSNAPPTVNSTLTLNAAPATLASSFKALNVSHNSPAVQTVSLKTDSATAMTDSSWSDLPSNAEDVASMKSTMDLTAFAASDTPEMPQEIAPENT